MPVDPTPWFREGASHSANIARVLAHAAFGGHGGIIDSKDCEVRELAIPGTSVRVYPGVVAMPNRANGSPVEGEMFGGRVPSETEVPIAATGAGAGRSDMIVARVYTLGETPPVPGQFFDLYVISGVPAGATRIDQTSEPDITGVPLARIDLPASTGTIEQGHITDLRRMSGVLNQRFFNVVAPTAYEALTSTSYVNWPTEGNLEVEIPEWATHASVRAILGGILVGDSASGATNVYGNLRIQMGSTYSQRTAYNASVDSGADRLTLMCGAPSLPVDPADRGTVVTVRIEGTRGGGSTNLASGAAAIVSLEVEFKAKPESNV